MGKRRIENREYEGACWKLESSNGNKETNKSRGLRTIRSTLDMRGNRTTARSIEASKQTTMLKLQN